jgi:predicted DsbA family dithiol-disulfide isomerase
MFCIIAFVVLFIMGIFSATHRELAKEAFACVTRRVTFRACDTGFKEKMQSHIVGTLLSKSIFLAKIVSKNFEIISWIFFIITVVSIVWSGKGLYNYLIYGNCNGLTASGFCALDPTGENTKSSAIGGSCSATDVKESAVTLASVNLSSFPTKNSDSEDSLVLIGCYNCDYTRKAYPTIKKLIENNKLNYTFAHYPVKSETTYLLPIGYCAYQNNSESYWKFNDTMFASNKEDVGNKEYVDGVLENLGYDLTTIYRCVDSQETKSSVVRQRIELEKTGIYGTPLVFINGKGIVGPKPYRVYDFMLNGIFGVKLSN